MRQRVRALLATPRFTIVALLTVTLLVCGITTIFSVVNGVVLRALPYPDADRLVRIEVLDPRDGTARTPIRSELERFANASRSFDLWSEYRLGYVTTLADLAGEPHQVQEVLVNANALSALGFQAARGRLLHAAEAEPVAVINQSLWKQLLGGREDALNRSVRLGKSAVTIIGVVREIDQPPLDWLQGPTVYRPVEQSDDRNPSLTTLARLRGDSNIQQARAELETMAASTSQGEVRRPKLTPLFDAIVGDSARLVWLFFGVAALVVLIGIGNLTSLQMARNADRRSEVKVRFALGASRPRLISELVAETATLGAVGGLAGLAAAAPMIRVVVQNLPARFPRADQIGIDITVGMFAISIAFAATLIIGFIGAWMITSSENTSHLTDAAIKGGRRPVLQGALIGAQTAAALILLVGTGLLLGSVARLIARDSGMREEGLWMAFASLPQRYQEEQARLAFWNAALSDVQQLPTVDHAALMVNGIPFSGNDYRQSGIVAEGSTVDPRTVPLISVRRVTADYFATVGMRMKRGRTFIAGDGPVNERVAVINDLAATQLFGRREALGKRFRWRNELLTVVGVIADYRHTRLEGELSPQLYVPHEQWPTGASGATILFRAATAQAVADVQSILLTKEKDVEILTSSMADQRWRLVALERFRIAVMAAFALTAVALAIVGIAGLVGYTVAQRAREVAIRIALGAAQLDIVRVTTIQTLLPATIGIVIGVAGAIAATRLITSYLVDMTALDLPTYLAAIIAMAIAVITASLIPARRATRIDPAVALRRD